MKAMLQTPHGRNSCACPFSQRHTKRVQASSQSICQTFCDDDRKVGFFEVHAENYMGDGGAPHVTLERLRRDYPIFLHGVAMSIGGAGPLNAEHLARFKRAGQTLRATGGVGTPCLVDPRHHLLQRPVAGAVQSRAA